MYPPAMLAATSAAARLVARSSRPLARSARVAVGSASTAPSLLRPHAHWEPPMPTRTLVSSARVSERVKGGQPSDGERQIIDILTKRFAPKQIQVADISGGCGSFYAITLTSKEFNGLSTIKQHRLVNKELKDVISGIHGLQLRTQAEE